MRRFLSFLDSRRGRVARYVFTLLLLAILVRNVDWVEIRNLRGDFAWWPVIWATLAAGLAFPVHAIRWWLLLRNQGIRVALPWTHAVTWIGQFYNAFLPGGVGGDAARLFYALRDQPAARSGAVAATLIDRILGFAVLCVLAILGALIELDVFLGDPVRQSLLLTCLVGVGVVLMTMIAIRAFRSHRWLRFVSRFIGKERSAALAESFVRATGSRADLACAIALSVLIWLLDFVSAWLLAGGVGLNVSFVKISVAMAVAYAATTLPVTIGGHGLRENTLLVMLGVFGITAGAGEMRDRALLLAVLVWSVTIFWSLVGGLVLVAFRPRRVVPETMLSDATSDRGARE